MFYSRFIKSIVRASWNGNLSKASIKMQPYLFILYLIYSVPLLARSDQLHPLNSVRMLNDLLQFDGIPISVYLRVCWPPAVIAQTYRTLVYHRITTLDHRRRHDRIALPPLLAPSLIVVDMDCACAQNWMSLMSATDMGHPIRWLLIRSNGTENMVWDGVPAWLDSHITVATWNSTAFKLEQGNIIWNPLYNKTLLK